MQNERNRLAALTKEKNSIHQDIVKKVTDQIKSFVEELQSIESRASERINLLSKLEGLSLTDDNFDNALLNQLDEFIIKLEKL